MQYISRLVEGECRFMGFMPYLWRSVEVIRHIVLILLFLGDRLSKI